MLQILKLSTKVIDNENHYQYIIIYNNVNDNHYQYVFIESSECFKTNYVMKTRHYSEERKMNNEKI